MQRTQFSELHLLYHSIQRVAVFYIGGPGKSSTRIAFAVVRPLHFARAKALRKYVDSEESLVARTRLSAIFDVDDG